VPVQLNIAAVVAALGIGSNIGLPYVHGLRELHLHDPVSKWICHGATNLFFYLSESDEDGFYGDSIYVEFGKIVETGLHDPGLEWMRNLQFAAALVCQKEQTVWHSNSMSKP
jgi:hypothetical protein